MNILLTVLFNGIKKGVGFILMNRFYDILDLLYKFNKKLPEIPFGQLIHNLTAKEEKLWWLSDDEIIKRLEEFLKEE
jgi:hypothetical protein